HRGSGRTGRRSRPPRRCSRTPTTGRATSSGETECWRASSTGQARRAAYEDATGHPVADMGLWDGWAVARSHDIVETWAANYRPLGRADLDEDELRRRHSQWTNRLQEQS